jgi:hypothetical protein
MTTEALLIDSALRAWKLNIDRADKFFSSLSEDELQEEIAPGKNRLIYLWGHLTAVNDALRPLLRLGPRLHPELDEVFITNPDRARPMISRKEMKQQWDEINASLWTEFSQFSASDWVQRHTAVSEDDFIREPHRNRYTVLLGRTVHLAYHLGQAVLTKRPAAG